jgi:hypothetical protein
MISGIVVNLSVASLDSFRASVTTPLNGPDLIETPIPVTTHAPVDVFEFDSERRYSSNQ